MNNKYINKKTYGIVDDVFEVDEDIAETISILNKKGYYTLYCCSGHVKDSRLYKKYHVENIKNDDEFPDSFIFQCIDGSYDILKPNTFTIIYIKFDKEYYFPSLPNGFYKSDDNIIEKIIDYYNKKTKRKSVDVDREIKTSNKQLFDWAEKLPNLSK